MRGGFFVDETDDVPPVNASCPSRMLVLFGNAGSSIWQEFASSTEYADGKADPMNRWSERVGNDMADKLGGLALFPFEGPPYRPFLQWAKKAESLQNSRLGMLMHPSYGLWHAYRFAIALPWESARLTNHMESTDICASCQDQPCLSGCPVRAFDGSFYDVESCYNYLKSSETTPCREACQARRACPEGTRFRYESRHARFHMDAFIRNMSRRFGDG